MPNDGGNGYAAVLRHEADLARLTAHPGYRAVTAMLCIRVGPITDWKVWLRDLDPSSNPFRTQPDRAIDTAVKVVERWAEVTAASAQDEAGAVLRKLAALIGTERDEDLSTRLADPARAAISTTAWWNADPPATAQGVACMRPSWPCVLSDPPPQRRSARPWGWTSPAPSCPGPRPFPTALRATWSPRSSRARWRSSRRVSGTSLRNRPCSRTTLLRVSRRPKREAHGEDPQADPYVITADEMIEYLGTGSRGQLLGAWYGLGPDAASGTRVAVELGATARGSERTSAVRWAAALTPPQRTEIALQVSELGNDTSAWIADLAREPLDEDRLLTALGDRLKAATRASERQDLARSIAAVRPTTPSGQNAVGQLAHWLFEQGKKADDEAATYLFPALGDKHRMGPTLAADVASAVARGSHFSRQALEDLRRANIPVRRKDVGGDFWDRFRPFRRR